MRKNKDLISGMWKSITPICGRNHEKMIRMNIGNSTKKTYVYECPVCKEAKNPNMIDMKEYERTINTLTDILMSENRICLKGKSWQKNFIKYEVIHHDILNDKMTIKIDNVKQE